MPDKQQFILHLEIYSNLDTCSDFHIGRDVFFLTKILKIVHAQKANSAIEHLKCKVNEKRD